MHILPHSGHQLLLIKHLPSGGLDLSGLFLSRLFVLPSFHEGLPIALALLEAMSYGIPVLVSDIPANKEVDLPAERYFRCGDVDDLRNKMEMLLNKGLTETERQDMRMLIEEKYNWNKIAEQTIAVYKKATAS